MEKHKRKIGRLYLGLLCFLAVFSLEYISCCVAFASGTVEETAVITEPQVEDFENAIEPETDEDSSVILSGKERQIFVLRLTARIVVLLIFVVLLIVGAISVLIAIFRVGKEHSWKVENRKAVMRFGDFMKQKIWKWRYVILAFFIPACTLFLTYAVIGVFPFGNHSVLVHDAVTQYLPFFTELHEKLINGDSLFYSFSSGMGYNLWASIAYYLANPLNIFIIAVPVEHIMDFMSYLILFKISLSGAVFAWYLSEREQFRGYYPVPFACMYALSAFMIGYGYNLMWLDSILVLPLIMYGIEQLVKNGSGKFFTISLFWGIYCNYYIGYILCIFSCLYFLVVWITENRHSIGDFVKLGLGFAWHGLLAGGMTAFLLLPAYLALKMTKSVGLSSLQWSSFLDSIQFNTSGIDQLTKHFALTECITISNNQADANIYCGVIILPLLVLFALDNEIRMRERIARICLVLFLLFSMNLNILNFVWHGFHEQYGIPNRFAFVYIAMLLIMGFDAIQDVRKLSIRRIGIAGIIPVLFAMFCYWRSLGEYEDYVYIVNIALLMLYGILLVLLCCRPHWFRILQAILALVMTIEVMVTGICNVCFVGITKRSVFLDEQKAYHVFLSRQPDYGTFFRSEIDSQHMYNENMFVGAYGLAMFSSIMPESFLDLCGHLGMNARMNATNYNGVTKLLNDVFGIRYVMSTITGNRVRQMETLYGKSLYQMEEIDEEGPLIFYENEDALSLGFMVSSDIKKWNTTGNSPMEIQADFVKLATGVPFSYTLREAYPLDDGITYRIDLHPGEQTYLQCVNFLFSENEVDTDDRCSLTIHTPQYTKTIVNMFSNVFNLGMAENEGDKADVLVSYKEGFVPVEPLSVRVYTCKDEDYQAVYEKLASNQMEQVEAASNKVSGTVHVDEAGTLLLTIPYDEGWDIMVDGKQEEAYPIGGALTGLDLRPGDYTIQMEFTPPGLYSGIIITLVSCLLFVTSCVYSKGHISACVSDNYRRERFCGV